MQRSNDFVGLNDFEDGVRYISFIRWWKEPKHVYFASLTFDPSIYVVVARKHISANSVHFHTDFEFGANVQLHLHAVHI